MTPAELQDPKARIAWLEQQGIEGFYLVSGDELARMQAVGRQLDAECRHWRSLSKATFDEADPIKAVAVCKAWLAVFKRLQGQKDRYRSALIDVIQQTPVGLHQDIARKGLKEPDKI